MPRHLLRRSTTPLASSDDPFHPWASSISIPKPFATRLMYCLCPFRRSLRLQRLPIRTRLIGRHGHVLPMCFGPRPWPHSRPRTVQRHVQLTSLPHTSRALRSFRIRWIACRLCLDSHAQVCYVWSDPSTRGAREQTNVTHGMCGRAHAHHVCQSVRLITYDRDATIRVGVQIKRIWGVCNMGKGLFITIDLNMSCNANCA